MMSPVDPMASGFTMARVVDRLVANRRSVCGSPKAVMVRRRENTVTEAPRKKSAEDRGSGGSHRFRNVRRALGS